MIKSLNPQSKKLRIRLNDRKTFNTLGFEKLILYKGLSYQNQFTD